MSYRTYVLFDIRKPRKEEYTGVTGTVLSTRLSARLSAARNGRRPELVNEWINKIGSKNVGIREVANCAIRSDAELIEQERIATITHVTLGGKNKRRK